MGQQFNSLPQYNVPLLIQGNTNKPWYFFLSSLFQGLPPALELTVTPGASPYTYSAPVKGFMIVQGGTVSKLEFVRDTVNTHDLGVTAGPIPLNAADRLIITYTVAPTLTFVQT